MRYATHLIDVSTDPDSVLTAQQIISAAVAASSGLAEIDIDTIAELNAILTDADLVTQARTITAGDGLTGGGDLSANRTVALSTANVDKLATLTVATETLSIDRGLLIGLYDHTIASGETDAPPAGAIFRSTVDGKVYQRLADGSTNLLNNASSEYGEGGSLFESSGTTNTPVIIQGVDGQAAALLQIKTHTGEITLTISQNGDIATDGQIFCEGLKFEAALPTSDPGSPGVVWNDAGTLKVSAF
jgi:hypothetical protein